MEKIYLASDHAAFEEKENLRSYLSSKYEVIDLGTNSSESVHYPQFAKDLANKVLESKSRGIILCGSGIGVSITVNRFTGIRGSLCRDVDDAIMTRKHNDSNVLCLAGRKTSMDDIKSISDAWLTTEFEGGRHQTRVEMIED
jgi:ribose 5-phosphate isomerase B